MLRPVFSDSFGSRINGVLPARDACVFVCAITINSTTINQWAWLTHSTNKAIRNRCSGICSRWWNWQWSSGTYVQLATVTIGRCYLLTEQWRRIRRSLKTRLMIWKWRSELWSDWTKHVDCIGCVDCYCWSCCIVFDWLYWPCLFCFVCILFCFVLFCFCFVLFLFCFVFVLFCFVLFCCPRSLVCFFVFDCPWIGGWFGLKWQNKLFWLNTLRFNMIESSRINFALMLW